MENFAKDLLYSMSKIRFQIHDLRPKNPAYTHLDGRPMIWKICAAKNPLRHNFLLFAF